MPVTFTKDMKLFTVTVIFIGNEDGNTCDLVIFPSTESDCKMCRGGFLTFYLCHLSV